MMSQRLVMRGALPFVRPARPSLLRSTLQRRLESTPAEAPRKTVEIPVSGIPELTGPANNAFNRERAAIKAHAAKSAGTTAILILQSMMLMQ